MDGGWFAGAGVDVAGEYVVCLGSAGPWPCWLVSFCAVLGGPVGAGTSFVLVPEGLSAVG